MSFDPALFQRLIESIAPKARFLSAQALEGGISTRATLVEFEDAAGSTRRIVVRQRGADHSAWSVNAAKTEFRLLQRLHALGLPTQRPVAVDTSGAILKSPCVILEYAEGAVRPEGLSTESTVIEMARTMGRFHALDPATSDLMFLPRQQDMLDQWLNTQEQPSDDAERAAKIRAALRAYPAPSGPPQRSLLHSDFWIGNLVWREGHIVCVLDWEDAHIGSPESDVAKCRLELLLLFGEPAMRAFTSAYAAESAEPLGSIAFWDLWGALRLIRYGEWASGPEQLCEWRSRFGEFVNAALSELERAI